MSLTAGLFVVAGGALSMLGWIASIPRLTDWDGNGITIKFNASICITTAGLTLVLLTLFPRNRIAITFCRFFAFVVMGFAAATLFQHITGVNLGIDTWFFDEQHGAPATSAPNRMGVPASSTLMLLGYALFLITITLANARQMAAKIAVAAFCIPALSLTGYFFGAQTLYSLPHITGIAFQTALMLAVLAIGIAFLIPEHGIVSIYQRRDAGGLMFRRLFIPLVVLSLIIGWIRLAGQSAGFYDTAFGTAARTLLEVILFSALLWWTANIVSRAEAATVKAQEEANEGRLHRQIAAAQDAERARLARDIHDHIGQDVTAMRMALKTLPSQDGNSLLLPAALTRMSDHLEKLDGDISHLAWQIRPPAIDGRGLSNALGHLGHEWSTHHGIVFDFQSSAAEGRLPDETETHLYRIAQEALNNISKHARAKNVGIALNYVDNEAILTVEDDGDGFDAGAIHKTGGRSGFGLVSIQERVTLMKGQLTIESQPGQGTAILIRVPAP